MWQKVFNGSVAMFLLGIYSISANYVQKIIILINFITLKSKNFYYLFYLFINYYYLFNL